MKKAKKNNKISVNVKNAYADSVVQIEELVSDENIFTYISRVKGEFDKPLFNSLSVPPMNSMSEIKPYGGKLLIIGKQSGTMHHSYSVYTTFSKGKA